MPVGHCSQVDVVKEYTEPGGQVLRQKGELRVSLEPDMRREPPSRSFHDRVENVLLPPNWLRAVKQLSFGRHMLKEWSFRPSPWSGYDREKKAVVEAVVL